MSGGGKMLAWADRWQITVLAVATVLSAVVVFLRTADMVELRFRLSVLERKIDEDRLAQWHLDQGSGIISRRLAK